MQKPVLVSGIQPTGRLHIGNYLGALKNFVELQNSGNYQCYFFVVDLHALTENPSPQDLNENVLNLTADFLAVGLSPAKVTISQQSQISAHSELMWILSTVTPIGDLERMTQFKDKAKKQANNINAGLLYYPVLMAADILLYDTEFVPIGDDQDQHLELTRTIARKFNSRFGETLKEPEGIHTQTPRIMDLRVPGKKMSKSDPAGCIFLDDSPEEIESKIKRAETDSHVSVEFDPISRPGISNLLQIYASFKGIEPKRAEKDFSGRTYAQFKSELSKTISDRFANFRKKKSELKAQSSKLKATLDAGSARAAKVAEKKIAEVKKRMGLC